VSRVAASRRLNVLYASVALGGGTSSITQIAKQSGMVLARWPRFDREPFDISWPWAGETYELRLLQDWRDNLGIGLDRAFIEYGWVRQYEEGYDPVDRRNFVAQGLQQVVKFLPSVDGIVLVVDSQRERLEAVKERVEVLERELASVQRSPGTMPVVFQLNKRDLPNATPVPELRAATRWRGPSTHVESVASRGDGVAEALAALLGLTSRMVS
jgi:hypothetical protein